MKNIRHRRVANESLKNLRKIIGVTQKKFAAMVGVSLPSIKAVESGQYPVKWPLANKISTATGAQLLWWDFHPGHQGKFPVPNGKIYWVPIGEEMADDSRTTKSRLSHTEYTMKHFEYHRRFFRSDSKAAELAIKEVLPVIKDMFLEASKPGLAGLKHRLPAMRRSLWNWICDAKKQFNLAIKLPHD